MGAPGTDLRGWRWLRGRANRQGYWLWTAVILAWGMLFAWSGDELPERVLVTVFWFQVIRRLHDLGRSGWWIVGFFVAEIALVAVAGARPAQDWAAAAPGLLILAAVIAIGAAPGERAPNRFGDPPGGLRRQAGAKPNAYGETFT